MSAARPLFPALEVALPAGAFAADAVRSALSRLDEGSPLVHRARQERNTQHFWIDAGTLSRPLRLFVKRYRTPLVRNVFTFVLKSRARREYEASRRAHALGLPAVPAIACGERRAASVVVDQIVAFLDLGECATASDLLRTKGEERKAWRRTLIERVASELGRMHDAGIAHLQASPRNVLLIGDPLRLDLAWIDFNAALFLERPIRATRDALADVLNLLENERMFAGEKSRDRFFAHYCPDRPEFREQVIALRKAGRTSYEETRAVKVRAATIRRRWGSSARTT